MGVVLDLDLRAELTNEPVKCCTLCSAHVRRGDDAERGTALTEPAQLRLQQTDPVPLHESAQQIDFVGGVQLRAQLRAQVGLVMRVGEKRSLAKRSTRPHPLVRPGSHFGGSIEAHQLRGRRDDCAIRPFEVPDQVVSDREATLGILGRAENLKHQGLKVPCQYVGLIYLVHVRNDGAITETGECFPQIGSE